MFRAICRSALSEGCAAHSYDPMIARQSRDRAKHLLRVLPILRNLAMRTWHVPLAS